MKRSELIKALLNKSALSVKELSEKLGVNRSNYYLWKSSRSVPKQSTINRMAELLNLKVVWYNQNEGEIEELEESINNELNTNDLIQYQRQEIKKLQYENERLKQNSVESILFSEQEYDWSTTVDIKVSFNGIKRKIKKIKNIGSLAKHLKATEKDLLPFFDLNNWHRMNDHPINKIITSQSLKNLERKTTLFTDIITNFKNLGKFFTGDHFITIFVDYSFKGNLCRTICYCKIIESEKISIVNKCKILSD